MIPPKLRRGDELRLLAPSHSLPPDFTPKMKTPAINGLKKRGLKVAFGKYVEEVDEFETTTIDHRQENLHEAFTDTNVKAIIPATGGSRVSQVLKYIDYPLIEKNPKVLCGLSDITALPYALYTKTGVVNDYGPHIAMLGSSKVVDYSSISIQKVKSKKELQGVPVVANLDFGHTVPNITLPIGGTIRMQGSNDNEVNIQLVKY